jgi:hypothetical protein
MAHHQGDSDSFTDVFGWRCPICNSTAYRQTLVGRPDGKPYLTEFFECCGCTLMFRHPNRFTRLGVTIRRWKMDIEPRTLASVHGLVIAVEEPKAANDSEERKGGEERTGKVE